jgi:two-component system sensor kinase FixL
MSSEAFQRAGWADVSVLFRQLSKRQRVIAICGGFIVAYILLAWLARFYMVRPFAITPWNPAGGLALAFLLVYGIRYWPALAIASIGTSLLLRGIPAAPYTQLLAPISLTIGYAAMAALLRGPLRFRLDFDRAGEIFKLAAVATVGTLLIALAYVEVFRAVGTMTTQDFNYITLRFWIGHLIGIVINTPLLLLLRQQPWKNLSFTSAEKWEIVAQIACVVLTLWLIFDPRWIDPYKFFYLLFLPVIWIATRHGSTGAIFGIAGVQTGLIIALVNSDFQSGTAVTEFQFMMLALAIAGLFLGMVVSESRTARVALDRSESRLRAIVATAPDSIVTVDHDGTIIAANPASEHVFAFDSNALPGLRVQYVLPEFDSFSTNGNAATTEGVRRDGTRFPAEVSVGRAGTGKSDLRIAVIRDITRRVETARQLAEQQEELGRTARLAAAGEMAAALAHELHQPLTAIRNYARAAQMQATPGHGNAIPAKIESEAARAAAVVQRLRDFFRGGTSQLERVDTGTLIEHAIAPMREDLARLGITLDLDVGCPAIVLLVDRIQVETVIHSLVHNASEALSGMPPARRVIRLTAQTQSAGWVQASIVDSGPGMAASMADRIFEPFATTKATGTGMGLAMSRSMIEAHGGRIWHESPAGGGTAFHFTLPVNEPGELPA